MSGPASNEVLGTLFSESATEIEDMITKTTTELHSTTSRSLFRTILGALIDAAESTARLYARLAADRAKAAQLERESLRILTRLKREVAMGDTEISTATSAIEQDLADLKSHLRQLPLSPLEESWPRPMTKHMFLHSIYRSGDMLTALQFLLERGEAGDLTILVANYDFAHLKLLDIIRRSGHSMKIVCEGSSASLVRRFPSLNDIVSVAPNLHSRMVASGASVVVSSADLKVESYTAHVEAGIMSEFETDELASFLATVWSRGIPLTKYKGGLSREDFMTSHVMIGVDTFENISKTVPITPLLQQMNSEVYRVMEKHGAPGYVESDRPTGELFINIRELERYPELRSELTSICGLQFGEFFSIMPVDKVVDANERPFHVKSALNGLDNVAVYLFSTGSNDEIAAAVKSVKVLALDEISDYKCTGYSLWSRQVLGDAIDASPDSPRKHLWLLQLGPHLAISRVFGAQEVEWKMVLRILNR